MKKVAIALALLVAFLKVSPADAAPITGLAWKDSTKVADTLIVRHSVASNLVPTKSSAGTIDSFLIIGTNTLPPGITLNKTTGAFTGTATGVFAAANRTLRAYSGTDSVTRTVRISAVGITSLSWKDSTKVADTLIFRHSVAANFVKTHLGGTIDSFAIIGTATLPTGVTFNKSTGAFTGTPTGVFAAANRTVRAYAMAGTDSLSRTVRVSAVGLTSLAWKDSTKAADTLIFRRGVAANYGQTHLGGAVDSFLIIGTNTLPTGITLDKTTGAFTGTATGVFAAANRTVRAYAKAGTDSLTRTVRVSAVGLTSLAWKDSTKTTDTLAFRRGVAQNLVPTLFGGPVDSFVVVGTTVNLPDGISLNKTTGALTGTATTTWAAANRTIRAYAGAGVDSLTRTVRFSSYLVTSLAWKDSTKPADTLNFSTGVPVNVTPTWLGGVLDSFANIGATALPAGLTLNPVTGAITGTPTTAFAAANRTLRGFRMSQGDSVTRTVRFTVTNGATSNLRYTKDTVTVAVGVPATNSPSFVGRTPQSYSVAPALPAGLTLNTTTGVITGRPTTVTAAANYVVTATDTVGTPDTTATRNLRITVAANEGSYSTGWTQHKTLWVNANPTTGGATITANVRKFPALVRLDASNFTGFAQVGPGQRDLRFSKSNGTTFLPFEVERWDSAGASAAVWVLLDTVYSANSTQNFLMHWGNTAVLNASSGAAAFDTANGDRTVLHFTGTSNAVNETDATVNATVASNRSTVDIQNPGVIGLGRDFNGTNEYFRMLASPSAVGNFPMNGSYTVSAWASANVSQADRAIVSKSGKAYGLKINATGMWEFSEYNSNSGTATGGSSANPWALQSAAAAAATDTAWHFVAGVSSGNTKRLYVDGILVATNTGTAIANFTGANNVAAVTTDSLTIGRFADTALGYWGGDLDEIRLASAARSDDYLKLSYLNQNFSQNVIAHALPVSVSGARAQARVATLTVLRTAAGVQFHFDGGESVTARLELMDITGRAVWSRSTATGRGMNTLVWDGRGMAGQTVANGLYAARLSLLDASGRAMTVLQSKVPLTR